MHPMKSTIFLLFLLPFSTLLAHRSPYLERTSESQRLARHFQEVALDSLKDASVQRAQTIELHLQAHQRAGQEVSAEQMHQQLSQLYAQLPGGHIARATLTASGWQTQAPSEPLVLTQSRLCKKLLLILFNQTSQRRTFSVSQADAAVDRQSARAS